MIGVDTAGELLDFRGPRRAIDEGAAAEQLRGAVAVHNILEEEGVAYLADEVGMGKTYVALRALSARSPSSGTSTPDSASWSSPRARTSSASG